MSHAERQGTFDFEPFVREHYARVLAYLQHRTRDPNLAEDLAQETFLQAYRSRERYDPERAGVREWVLGIARNVSAYAARQRERSSRELRLAETIAEAAWTVQRSGSEEEARLSALRRCLGALAERARTILGLLYDRSLTYDQIAQELHVGLSAVKMAASRARQSLLDCLRRKLAPSGGGPENAG